MATSPSMLLTGSLKPLLPPWRDRSPDYSTPGHHRTVPPAWAIFLQQKSTMSPKGRGCVLTHLFGPVPSSEKVLSLCLPNE